MEVMMQVWCGCGGARCNFLPISPVGGQPSIHTPCHRSHLHLFTFSFSRYPPAILHSYAVEGIGCCPDAQTVPNPNHEGGCKAGPPRPFSTTKKNVIIMGDSVSMGYTPWVATHLGTEEFMVQHSVWGDGSAVCNVNTSPPCDPDPTGKYTGDGGDEETAYGEYCLDYFLRHPDGSAIKPDVIMYNWGLHDGPLGNGTHPGQQGNSSVYPGQLQNIAARLHTFCSQNGCKLLFALTSAMMCKVSANDNVSGLNHAARGIMAQLQIPTVDLQSAIIGKCGPVPQLECFGIQDCFCPHCPNSLARPSPGYEWLAESTIVPAILKLV
jgi:hypothetical protein